MGEVIELDWSKLNLRGAITGTIALAVVIVFIGAWGDVTIAAGLAAVFVIAGGPSATKRPDGNSLLLVLGGALVTFVVSLSADSAVAATITLTVVTLLATLLALRGPRAATMGMFAVLWAVVALTIGTTPEIAVSMSVAFAVGGGVAMIAMWLVSLRTETALPTDSDDDDGPEPDPGTAMVQGPARVAIIKFAIVRALAVGACVLLGYEWFPDHSAWAALTFVLVVKPPPHQTVVVALGRGLGTALGVVVAVLITQLADGNMIGLIIVFVAAAYLMLATSNVNSALSTTFTTILVVVSQAMLAEQASVAGWQRLLATLLGVGFAFLGILVLMAISDRRKHEPTAQAN